MKIKLNTIIFFSLLLIMVVTFFTRNSYRGVDSVAPEVLLQPIQEELVGPNIISFTKDDYKYTVSPLYVYEISGLIVHRLDYTWFSIYKKDSVFPLDLCMMWGNDVERGIYKSRDLSFRQDSRFCWWQWSGKLNVNNSEISNSHLVIDNKDIEAKLKDLNEGDQVKITGFLSNIDAINTGDPGEYDPPEFSLQTSTTRDDSGPGACEIIYVTGIEILKKGNPISVWLFLLSKYGLAIFFAVNFLMFVYNETLAKRWAEKPNFEIE